MARDIDYTPAFRAAEYVFGQEPVFSNPRVRCKNCGSVSQMKRICISEDANRKHIYENWQCGCGATATFTFAKVEEEYRTKHGTKL